MGRKTMYDLTVGRTLKEGRCCIKEIKTESLEMMMLACFLCPLVSLAAAIPIDLGVSLMLGELKLGLSAVLLMGSSIAIIPIFLVSYLIYRSRGVDGRN